MDWDSPSGAGIIAAIVGAVGAVLVALGKGIAWLSSLPRRVIADQREQLEASMAELDAERTARRAAEAERDQALQANAACERDRAHLRATVEAMGLPPRPVRALIVEDEELFRLLLRRYLEGVGVLVVGEAVDGHEGVRLALELLPDVVLMDLHLPGLDGVDATRQIIEQWPEARVLVLTGGAGDEWVTQVRRAGAADVLLKSSVTGGNLLTAIGRAMRGRR